MVASMPREIWPCTETVPATQRLPDGSSVITLLPEGALLLEEAYGSQAYPSGDAKTVAAFDAR